MRISGNEVVRFFNRLAPKLEQAQARLAIARQPAQDVFEVQRATGAARSASTASWLNGQESVASRPAPRLEPETARAVVSSLYRGVLGREPDAQGLAGWAALAEQGQLGQVVDGFLRSDELTKKAEGLSPDTLSRQLYAGILGRSADAEGHDATVSSTARGHLGHRIIDMLLSPEHAQRLAGGPTPPPPPEVPAPPTPGPGPTPSLPPEPGPALSTVPMRAVYATATIDKSSDSTAVKSAAAWVKQTYPGLFVFPNGDDRQEAFETMAHVIGALRAHGYDAFRVVNHPGRPVGDGYRYGSDALVLNGRIYDVYASHGDPNASHPQAMDVGPHNFSRPRE